MIAPARTLLLTGFGPFRSVDVNPTAELVQRLNGRTIAGVRVIGVVLPVSWERAPAIALDLVAEHNPIAVIGFGVATPRAAVMVETQAHRRRFGPDVDGAHGVDRATGPDLVRATLNPEALARALGVATSDDAGAYVCNTWLYEVALRSPAPATFIHVPAVGMDAEHLASALEVWMRAERRALKLA